MHFIKKLRKSGGSWCFVVPKIWLDGCREAGLSTDHVRVSINEGFITISPVPKTVGEN